MSGERANESQTEKIHPLQYSWVLWYNPKRSTHSSFHNDVQALVKISTVEDFWNLFDNIFPPSSLKGGSYLLFKEGIKPEWEHPANAEGGKWGMDVGLLRKGSQLDSLWTNTIMLVIGEGFEDTQSKDICGVAVHNRRGSNRLSIWTRNALNENLTLSIGSKWKQAVAPRANLSYKIHEERRTGGNLTQNSAYRV